MSVYELHFSIWCIYIKENIPLKLSKEFAIDIINLCNNATCNKRSDKLLDQLLRSGTSFGANIYEGNYASSKVNFINKFQIALKKCFETSYWLEFFTESNVINQENYELLSIKCNKIRIMHSSSINTVKSNAK